MTQITLAIGSLCLAFGPLISLFIVVVYPKAVNVILLTSAAFFGLIAATASGLLYASISWALESPIVAVIFGVFFQFVFRCAYVSCYHKVEMVVLDSLAKDNSAVTTSNNNPTNNENNTAEAATGVEKLALNDATAAIASAVGFGGMQATLLFGSLWASEFNTLGVLYQDFCPLPSIAVSALSTAIISILQVFWMLLTFFGLRRRMVYGRGQGTKWESRSGGNNALLLALGSHMMVGGVSFANSVTNGCFVSIPALFVILFGTAFAFWVGCGRSYLIHSETRHE